MTAPALPPEQMHELADMVARRVVELMKIDEAPDASPRVLDVAGVAARYGVSRGWVYDHADALGAIRLGDVGEGKRPRLRFDAATVAAYFDARRLGTAEPAPPPGTARRPPASTTANGAPLLEIRGGSR